MRARGRLRDPVARQGATGHGSHSAGICDREVMVAAFGATGVLYRMRHRALRSPQLLYRCLLLAALCFTSLVVPAVRAQDRELDIDVVYQALEPYGRWFEHAVWGTVWQPTVEPGWRPYTRGMWVYSDAEGWYWEAEEPWGWAPFHYGRWLLDTSGTWIWLPDTEWAPAWVAWQVSDDYAGWAPLPPEAVWGADGELLPATAILAGPGRQSQWCFVRPHQLILPGLYRYLLPPRTADLALAAMRPAYPRRSATGGIVNAGFDVRRLERMTGRPVPRLLLKSVDTPQAARAGGGRGYGQELAVYRPRLMPPANGGGRLQPALLARHTPAVPATAGGREPPPQIPAAARQRRPERRPATTAARPPARAPARPSRRWHGHGRHRCRQWRQRRPRQYPPRVPRPPISAGHHPTATTAAAPAARVASPPAPAGWPRYQLRDPHCRAGRGPLSGQPCRSNPKP